MQARPLTNIIEMPDGSSVGVSLTDYTRQWNLSGLSPTVPQRGSRYPHHGTSSWWFADDADRQTTEVDQALLYAVLLAWIASEIALNHPAMWPWRTSFQSELAGVGAMKILRLAGNGHHAHPNGHPAHAVASPSLYERYPAPLMEEYRALIGKKFRRTLNAEDAARLQSVREEINTIDRDRPRPDVWDMQHEKLREELAQIRAEAEALPKV